MKQIIPKGYEIRGYEELQNQMFNKYQSVYTYRQCVNCNYTVAEYGKPYGILFKPAISDSIPEKTLLLVFSQPNEYKMRVLFRNVTQHLREFYSISYFFVLTRDDTIENGMKLLKKEYDQFKDMLIFNHTNSYGNLLLNVFHSFNYVHNLDLSYRYFVKMDVDVAVNIPMLMNILYDPVVFNRDKVYLGDCLFGEYVRDETSKLYVPQEIYRDDYTIRGFARGGLYVLSKSVMGPLLIGLRHLKFLTHHEDMVSGRALELMGIHCDLSYGKRWMSRYGCDLGDECKDFVSIHPNVSRDEVPGYYDLFWRKQKHVILNEVDISDYPYF